MGLLGHVLERSGVHIIIEVVNSQFLLSLFLLLDRFLRFLHVSAEFLVWIVTFLAQAFLSAENLDVFFESGLILPHNLHLKIGSLISQDIIVGPCFFHQGASFLNELINKFIACINLSNIFHRSWSLSESIEQEAFLCVFVSLLVCLHNLESVVFQVFRN